MSNTNNISEKIEDIPLSDTFLQSCSRESGYIIRGENMTRIETFVDAAFAFAITMLVISLDSIPSSPKELFALSADIPAFLASGMQIGFIWYRHSQWSRRFGLQDKTTVFLSLCLVMLVLIFIYPLKLVFMGLFSWVSAGWLSVGLTQMTLDDLGNLFLYFAIGLFCLSIIFNRLNQHALKLKDYLQLTRFEIHQTETEAGGWLIAAEVATIAAILSQTLPGIWVTASGFIYGLLGFTNAWWHRYRIRIYKQEVYPTK